MKTDCNEHFENKGTSDEIGPQRSETLSNSSPELESAVTTFLDLLDFIEHEFELLGSNPRVPASSENETRRFIFQKIFTRVEKAGINLTDANSVQTFLDLFHLFNPGLAEKFDKEINMAKEEGFVSPQDKDIFQQKTFSTSGRSMENGPEKEPDYPTLSTASWVLVAAITSGIIGFVFPLAFIATFFAGLMWFQVIFDPSYAIERDARAAFRIRREKWAVERRAAIRSEQQELYRQKNDAAYAQRKVVRRMIEKMPEYQIWRQEVLERDGRKCRVIRCLRIDLEVDHIASLDSIIKGYRVANEYEARECRALWDVNNGRTLCKPHHDQTATSRYRASKL